MFDVYTSSGYDLYQPFENIDQWVIDSKNGQACHGTFKEVVQFMIQKLGFRMEDIEFAIDLFLDSSEMDTLTNAVHFGINKTAIYTFNYEEHYGKRAG